MTNYGLLLTGAPAVPEMVSIAQRAEAAGFESIWVAETRLTRDAFVPMAAIAQATTTLRVASGIVNVFTRNPVVLAISFLGLEELAPGRIVLGLGTGSPTVLAPQGVPFERPLTRLKEYCAVLPPLMRGEEVSFDGRYVRLAGARIEDLLQPDSGGPRPDMPLVIGATGPKALQFSGSVADGVLMNVCLPTEYVTSRLELIEAGAQEAGRTREDLEIGMGILVSPHSDSATGKERARQFIALYLSAMPNIAKETGLANGVLEEIRSVFAAEGLAAAARLVSDHTVDRLAVAGTPDECRARLDAYRQAGVDTVVMTPVPGAMDAVIEQLSPMSHTPA
jgi:5,10-methylenetetrahydromethanopterin reductase